MSKKTFLWIAAGFALLFLVAFGMFIHLSSLPPVMSATDGPPPTVTWASLWGMIASGAFIPMIAAFIKSHQTQIDSAGDAIKGIATNIGGQKAATAIEAVQSALAYAANRQDPTVRARFINAQLAEIRDILITANPAISVPLNALVIAITNAQFPVKATPSVSFTNDPFQPSVLK